MLQSRRTYQHYHRFGSSEPSNHEGGKWGYDTDGLDYAVS